ncbi:LysR family transcriptional regulator [Paracoccus sediminilitoris]|uniref:LysR family transcriptional regulator n=1 Tax=Paracoccus sediminilitoris TaxID=2202419 RepID=UPI001F157398|nr:LysR family transcriptional regulator [Paracoccus sediminilitoris]
MNLRQLKFFLATAELGQVSRAASELSVSQSSVTSAIRELNRAWVPRYSPARPMAWT